jgi:glycosyltransferase involved in cell wall biosynthesis
VYNPLNPFFVPQISGTTSRYASGAIVSAGYLGESKGVHRLLAMWPKIRRARPDVVLAIAGSSRLYNEGRRVGSFGLADPAFEERYLRPVAQEFGSLEAAGVRFVGLLSPDRLRALYAESSVGVVNLNWDKDVETFCCTAVEMLATELPVFGVAVGGLPETIGKSGGAVLTSSPDLSEAAHQLIALLDRPGWLAQQGRTGRQYVLERYSVQRVADDWERILGSPAVRLAAASGPWRARRGARYWLERIAGAAGLGRSIDRMAQWVRGA